MDLSLQLLDRATGLAADTATRFFAGVVLGERPLSSLASDVARIACETLPGVDEASVTLNGTQRGGVVVFSGSLAAALDERQYGPGFGPALDAAQSGSLLRIDDTGSGGEYPDFSAVASRQGVSSVTALALSLGGEERGSIAFYRRGQQTPFSQQELAAVVAFASVAAITLGNAVRFDRLERRLQRFEASLRSRMVIEQAKGLLMAQLGIDADGAFKVLVHRSQQVNGRKVRDIAEDVIAVAEGDRPPPELA